MKRRVIARLLHPRHEGSLKQPLALIFLLAVLFVLAATQVQGQGLDGQRVTMRGFGTLAATTHDAEGLEFRRNVGQKRGVDAHEIGWETDSLAGLQLNATLGGDVDALVQAVTRQNADGGWSPDVTQAFVRYAPDESLALRVGRIGYDIYLLAESRQVGYSYLTVRPSADFYGMVTSDEIDGADITITRRLGAGLARGRLFGGKGFDETVFADGSTAGGDSRVYGAAFDYLYRRFTARVAYLQATYKESASLRPLTDVLIASGVPASVTIGRELRGDQTSRGLQLGIAFDDGPLQLQVLHGRIVSDSIAGPNIEAWYAHGGYRFGDWTPFVALAYSRDRRDIRATGLPDLPELAPVDETVYSIQKNLRATQHTASAGVRWDVSPRIDLKLQADFTSVRDSSYNFDRRPAGSGPTSMTVGTLALDFVF